MDGARAARAARTSTRSRATSSAYGIDCDYEATGDLLRRARAARAGRGSRRTRSCCAASGTTRTCSTASDARARSHSPLFLGGVCGPHRRRRCVHPGKLADGLRAAAVRRGVRSTSTARCASCTRRATGVSVAHRRRRRARARRAARHQRLSRRCCARSRRYVAPVYDYALVTEPLTPTSASVDRLARPPGHRRHGQPVPLLPPDRRRPDPVGRLRRRLPLRRPGRPRARRPRRRRSPRSRSTSSRTFPQLEGVALQPPLGRRDRHLQPLLGVLRDGARRPRRVRARLHRPRRRRHAASADASRSTCSTAATPRRPRCRWCAAGRCRSRPSRCAAR